MPRHAPPSYAPAGDPEQVAGELSSRFAARLGREPTVVAAAPGRVNLIGEHLDYNDGRCLPLALPHATYAALAAREDRVLSITSVQMEQTREVALDDLRPGAVAGWATYVAGVVWALAEEGWSVPGLDIVVDSRVPIGSGLSSSAALECAVALGVVEILSLPDNTQLRRELVEVCMRAESEMAGAPTGGMDQSVALLGESGQALLLDFADGSARPVPWEPETEGLALVVVDTRVSHSLADGGYASRRAECEAAARSLGVRTLREMQGRADALEELTDPSVRRRARHVLSEMDRVDAAVAALERGEHAALGPLLDASHDSLRDDFEVSCAELDLAVETMRRQGALGARMTGAGFGGSAIALMPVDAVDEATAAVTGAFEDLAWRAPLFLRASASDGARRLR